MSIRICEADLRLLNLKTRLPFRFGVVEMTSVPHAVVRMRVVIDGVEATGWAADHLPPKWLTKSEHLSLQEEAQWTCDVISHACKLAEGIEALTVFDAWMKVYNAQREWGVQAEMPALLSNFGSTFVERALIDAYCQAKEITFAEAVHRNGLGINVGHIYSELQDVHLADVFSERPLTRVEIRHTVGHGAPLTTSDLSAGSDPADGLPVTLVENIKVYGLKKFKVKLVGDVDADQKWIARVLDVLHQHASPDFSFSLDANEQYASVAALRALIESLRNQCPGDEFLDRLLFVEQPFPREHTLSNSFSEALRDWTEAPPIIIDEADDQLKTCREALDAGYAGTSHKNCKGVFKSVANRCLLTYRGQREESGNYILSAEDLTTIGPLSLQQDLAVVATLGIPHVERNGQHFFRGLEAFEEPIQRSLLRRHPDLYENHPDGFAFMKIRNGGVSLQSVVRQPFGHGHSQALQTWFSSLDRPDDWHPPETH